MIKTSDDIWRHIILIRYAPFFNYIRLFEAAPRVILDVEEQNIQYDVLAVNQTK